MPKQCIEVKRSLDYSFSFTRSIKLAWYWYIEIITEQSDIELIDNDSIVPDMVIDALLH